MLQEVHVVAFQLGEAGVTELDKSELAVFGEFGCQLDCFSGGLQVLLVFLGTYVYGLGLEYLVQGVAVVGKHQIKE